MSRQDIQKRNGWRRANKKLAIHRKEDNGNSFIVEHINSAKKDFN